MPFSRRGGSMGNIFLIKYKLKRKKKKKFKLTPRLQNFRASTSFFRHQRPSLAAGGHSGSRISHRLTGEVGEKNSDHSIFPYTVDGYRCDSVLLVWQPLVWQGDHCKRTTDLNNTHHLFKHTVLWTYSQTKRTRQPQPSHQWDCLENNNILITPLFTLLFLGAGGVRKTNKPLAGWGHSHAARKQEVMLLFFFWTD